MTTKSIYKDFYIKDKSLAESFVNALEYASNKQGKEVSYKKMAREINPKQIKNILV